MINKEENNELYYIKIKKEKKNKYIELKHQNNSKCKIYFKGAQITSFTTSSGEELLFMSSKAIYDDDNKAIRGGIPICFPQFGGKGKKIIKIGNLESHGNNLHSKTRIC
jgi:D-hexose-6-phosphate mutarotase